MASKFGNALLRFIIDYNKGIVAKTPQAVQRYEYSRSTIKKGHVITVKNLEDVAMLERLIKAGDFKGLVELPAAIAACNSALGKQVSDLQKYPGIKSRVI